MAVTKLPGFKPIPAGIDRELAGSLTAIQEALEVRLGRRGDSLDRAITLRELIDSGLAVVLANNPYNPNTGATGFSAPSALLGNVIVPPTPLDFRVEVLFKDIALFWHVSRSSRPFSNYAFTEIWRSQDEDLSGAVLIGTTSAYSYTDSSTEYDRTYYYWVRYVSDDNTPGPWSSMGKGTTIENIAATMVALSETLADLPGYDLLATGQNAAVVIKASSTPSTRTDGSALGPHDFWVDTDDGQVYTRNAANSAWVAGRDSTLVSLYGATSYTGSTITSAMASAQADIITVTSAQSSTAASLSSLSTIVTNNNNTLTSAITTEASSRTTGDQTNATAITNLTSTVVGNNNTLTASVNTLGTTTANINGDLDAMYVINVATESNGSKSAAGMVIGSNANSGSGATSYVQFRADTFAIWNPSTTSTVAPFIIDSGVVYIDTARIKDASITEAKIGTLSAEKITTGILNVSDRISANSIDGTKITAESIGADRIVANSITSGQIAANSILAGDILLDDSVMFDTNASGALILKQAGVGTLQIGINAVSLFAIATGNAIQWGPADALPQTTIAETAVFQAPQITTNPFAIVGHTMVLVNSGAAADFVWLRLYRRSGSTSGAASGASYTLIQSFKMFGDSAEAIQTITAAEAFTSEYYYQYKMTLQTYGTSEINAQTRTVGPSTLQIYVTFR
jgi:hypothetical protein